jgi:hypothetical protein
MSTVRNTSGNLAPLLSLHFKFVNSFSENTLNILRHKKGLLGILVKIYNRLSSIYR